MPRLNQRAPCSFYLHAFRGRPVVRTCRAGLESSDSEEILKTKSGLIFALSVSSLLAQQPPSTPTAGPMKESSMEVRFQLDLKVPDDVIKPYLPEGFTSSVATQTGFEPATFSLGK